MKLIFQKLVSHILPDDPCHNSHCHITLCVDLRQDKADFILLPGHPAVVTGSGNGVYPVGKTDVHRPVVHIGDSSGVLCLQLAPAEFFLGVGFLHTADIHLQPDPITVFSLNLQNTDKDLVTYIIVVMTVTDPVPGRLRA